MKTGARGISTSVVAAGLAALACAGAVRAHHSGYMYKTTPIWISGSVTRVEIKNPHSIITLEDRSQDGQVSLWAVEGPPQTAVDQRGVNERVPKVGDTIKVCAFPYRPADEIARDPRISGGDGSARRSSTTIDGSSPQYVAGHVIVMPDGAMDFWEPHGIISECMRSSDDKRPAWVDLLNANPRARQLWCGHWRDAVDQSNVSLREFFEAINSSLYEPCK